MKLYFRRLGKRLKDMGYKFSTLFFPIVILVDTKRGFRRFYLLKKITRPKQFCKFKRLDALKREKENIFDANKSGYKKLF